jgi:hypothetical protein
MLQAKLFGDNDLVIKSYSSDVCHYYLSLTVMLQAKLFGDNDLVIKSYPSDVCDYYLSLNVMLQTKLFGDSDHLLTKSRTHQMFFSISINLCKYGYLEHQGKLKASNLSCKYPSNLPAGMLWGFTH